MVASRLSACRLGTCHRASGAPRPGAPSFACATSCLASAPRPLARRLTCSMTSGAIQQGVPTKVRMQRPPDPLRSPV